MFEVFSSPEERVFKTHICSKATVFVFITFALIFLAPFFIVFYRQDYWDQVEFVEKWDQPKIQFRQELFGVIQEGDTTSICTTYDNMKQFYLEHYKLCPFKVSEVETNNDGKNDYLVFQMEIPLADLSQITNVQLILVFLYQLEEPAFYDMESLATINVTPPPQTLVTTVFGNLLTTQREPFYSSGRNTIYANGIIDANSTNPEELNMAAILRTYNKRNITTQVKDVSVTHSTGLRPSGQPYTFQLRLNYKHHILLYYRSTWDQLVYGIIVYLIFLIPFFVVGAAVKSFVLNNDLLVSYKLRPLLMRPSKSKSS